MSLPNFLAPGSPPRSPHVAPPSFLNSYFAPGVAPTSRPIFSLRPTRRDVLLCLLTLSFSYLLFSSPENPALNPTLGPDGQPLSSSSDAAIGRLSRFGSFSSFFPLSGKSADEVCAVPRIIPHEASFSETVKSVGLAPRNDDEGLFRPAHGSAPWAEGEEDEDDEFERETTVLVNHSPGWTLFDKLYLYNGSFYVITDEPSSWPELRLITSTGMPANNEPGNEQAREPKGNEIIYVSPLEAHELWGQQVYKMSGMTWLFNDGQFIDHYYHFAAELLLGTWRVHASLDPDITADGTTSLPPPRRIWFLHQSQSEWRDHPRFNPTIMYGLFPNVAMLYPPDFDDLAKSTASTYRPKAYVLEHALLADRSAAFRGPFTGPTARTVAGALQVGTASRWWWEPVRRQILRFSGVDEEIISRNLEGYGAIDPVRVAKMIGPGAPEIEPIAPPGDYRPVVTYISRQSSRRRLTPESHEDLVNALEERAKKVGFELIVVEAERMTKEEQFALAGRTTIMLGVHGNGLSHLLWMPATPRSAVIEMFFVGGFARDYQWTAHALGIRHFAIQHDVSFTSPNLPEVNYPEGFQGSSITVVGKVVADVIEDRLRGKI